MPMQIPTFEEYKDALELVENYKAIEERVLQRAIDRGEVRVRSGYEVAMGELHRYLDTRNTQKNFNVDHIREVRPQTQIIHGKTIAAEIKKRSDYTLVGNDASGNSLFARKALPRSAK